ncbi:SRPBCC family protein [Nocardia sienata]|uniref:SRPBCC family protein n=1 Tax=Nocardia sienata TaxID=248552 RepID=UPI001FDFB8DC|nr:SRPBCC domain-containing protein [Nocardia sienata]
MTTMPTGLTADAGWQIGVSRTLPQPPDIVWHHLIGAAGTACWLGPGADPTFTPGARYRTDTGVTGEIRGYRPGERIRLTYGPTTVQVTLTPATGHRTRVRFHQERMSSAAEREQQRAHWQRVMDELAAALDMYRPGSAGGDLDTR